MDLIYTHIDLILHIYLLKNLDIRLNRKYSRMIIIK